MNTTDITILTPAQFTAARALAKAFYHMWGMVPDCTYDVEEINKIASGWEHPDLPGGIDAPSLDDNGNVVHSTGTGRLHWTVNPAGDVTLKVYRPNAASKFSKNVSRYISNDETKSRIWEEVNEVGQLIACVRILNNDAETFDIIDETAEFYIETNDYLLAEKPHCKLMDSRDEQFYSFYSEEAMDQRRLFERHVNALVRPLVALQEAGTNAENEPGTEEYRQEIIYPAIAQAKEWLAPLYEIALPDPYWQREGEEPPQSYYTEADNYNLEKIYSVVQGSESFPVESEKTAVNAVLRLRKDPKQSLLDAVKAAIINNAYRPE